MKLRVQAGAQVYLRFGADPDPSHKLAVANAPLTNISRGEFNIGLFVEQAAKDAGDAPVADTSTACRAMMVQNHDHANFRFATVHWPGKGPSGDAASVLEVDAADGRAKLVADAAPHVAGFQIVLGPGAARLYLFGGPLMT